MLTATMTLVIVSPIECLLNQDGSRVWRRTKVVGGTWRVLRTEVERGVGCEVENTIMRQICPWCEGSKVLACAKCGGTGGDPLSTSICRVCKGSGDVNCLDCQGLGEVEVEIELETEALRAAVAGGAIMEME